MHRSTTQATLDARTDLELVHLGRGGDLTALGYLLERHRAPMLAVALAVLDRPSEAEDAVQDAMITALTRIGDLRDLSAVGPWLKMIVRNRCRMELRARRPMLGADMSHALAAADPARTAERHDVNDRVWHAMERLPPPLRLVTMLRYFTDLNTYEQIGAVCEVPVGTVRSRLSKARERLSRELLTAADPDHDVMALSRARLREARTAVGLGAQGRFGEVLRELWHPEVETTWVDGSRTRGRPPVLQAVDDALDAGMQIGVGDVVASRQIVIWEFKITHSGDDPAHCPVRPFWLQFLEGGRVERLRRFADRSSAA
ncbi:sigma-70 family RNA polymerase sigma factor [Spongiactinospora sp. TRM90649]|uniref:RNA polymerase sigma factor n=1 Tax=Spongiactinospora sp. TRM90649 TaxID=3031114 RepID=UPI0023F85B91|nr:sigma-70 family RNA polymerase sigma factor [Spongiactinospora sp. TRM90649]MDF5757539.1 sigma-70 family RNA polymerase sigma factor [Spongiactinospora sp. TRM90649]